MTHRIVRVLCSTIVLALVLASLAVPLLYQTAVLADGVDGGECRSGYIVASSRTGGCEPALVADAGSQVWWRDGDGAPVAEAICSGYIVTCGRCEPAPIASGTIYWG
jgi:hypothetical protein